MWKWWLVGSSGGGVCGEGRGDGGFEELVLVIVGACGGGEVTVSFRWRQWCGVGWGEMKRVCGQLFE